MVGVNSSGARILPLPALAVLLAMVSSEISAQTYYWNPSPIGTHEAQKAFNWTENNLANGPRNHPPSDRDDKFDGPALDTVWKFVDYDGPQYAATCSLTTVPGKLTLKAAGRDVWFDVNEFAGVYRADIKGNFDVSVRLDSLAHADPWTKAGIMIWNDWTTFATEGGLITSGGGLTVIATGARGITAQADLSGTQGSIDAPSSNGSAFSYPCWLRVTRVGTEYRGYFRTDTTAAWTLINNTSYSPLGSVAGGSSHIGLFVTSHSQGNPATAVFDDFRGGGNLATSGLDLKFAAGPGGGVNATLGANLGAKSVDFTGYTGAFSFGNSSLSVSGDLTFSPGMSILPGTGRIILSGTSGVQNLTPKANDTLPAIWKTGGSEAVVLGNPLVADSLHVAAGTFDLNTLNAHLQQFTASGGAGTLKGLPSLDDTLYIHQRAAFGGLGTLDVGQGVVIVKAVGAGRTVAFDPGGKSFRNVTLWAVPTGSPGAAVQVGPGALTVNGDLVLRQQRAPAGQNAEISFQAGNPNVTVAGNVTQVVDGAAGGNALPIRMGDGAWSVGGSVAFSLAAGSAGVATLDLTRAGSPQTLNVTGGALHAVRHSGSGTVFLASPLSANSLTLTAGTFNLGGNDLSLSGNLVVDGAPNLLDGLGGRTLNVGGNASFKGRPGNLLSLSPSTPWFIKVNGAGTLTAEYASLANSDASAGPIGVADSNSVDLGGNINWSFGGGAPTLPPRVTSEPRDTAVVEGANASFSVTASGTGTLVYAWKRDNDTTTLGSGPSLSLANVTLAMNGWTYRCIVSSTVGKDTSAPARLTVNRAPVAARVALEPVDRLGQVGGAATFSFTAEGDAPLAYAWYRKGTAAPIDSTASLALSGLTLAQDSSYYYCVVSNPHGSDTTREALLTVVPLPVPARITAEPRDTSLFVTERAVFRVAASGSDPIAFQWRRKGDTTVLSTDTVFAIASVSLNLDSSLYYCIVSNAYGRDTTREALLRVRPPPLVPAIIREPSDTLVRAGARVSFSVGVLGSAPLTYEWRLSGGDSSVLSRDSLFVLDSVSKDRDGSSFYVIVANASGKDTSAEAHLTVRVCDSLTIQVSPDAVVNEGQNVSLFGKAVCADRFEWSVVSGPAPRLLDPGADTLAFKAPRVAGDTALRYLFSAWLGDSVHTRTVTVRIRESIPDPSMTLPTAPAAWTGADPLVIRPSIFNKAQLDVFTGYPLRYAWTLSPLLADTTLGADSLSLKNPTGDGRMEVVLCLDNGGKPACDTLHVDVAREATDLARRGTLLPGGLVLAGSRLTWSRPGLVRIWALQGRLLFESRGQAGSSALLPQSALGALRNRAARLVFSY